METLALDVGSSSVKAAILRNRRIVGHVAREAFPTRFSGVRAEVDPAKVLRAISAATAQLGPAARGADLVALTNMAPSWVAMDARGKALTPIVTHQDRRSIEVAKDLLTALGEDRWLRIAGNLPFPGGISCTTWAWFLRSEPQLMRRADLVGHLNTYLHRQFTGARVTDPSNASFMGVYSTLDMAGWSDDLCDAVGESRSTLPEVREADRIGGHLTPSAASRLGLAAGTPMTVGCMDTSAALLLVGIRPGQLLNVSGSTDVLALCTDRPVPHPRLLTRAVGIGRRWLSVSTLAAAGSAITWAKDQLFADYPIERFRSLLARLARRPDIGGVRFDPYLAGDRMSIEQRQGGFSGLTLSTTREHMLSAIVESLAAASAARIPLLRQGGTKVRRQVMVSGGTQSWLGKVLHRDWPGQWTFVAQEEATLRGLGTLVTRAVAGP